MSPSSPGSRTVSFQHRFHSGHRTSARPHRQRFTLNGDQWDDLVITNAFDNTLTIAFQTTPGSFANTVTRPLGIGSSSVRIVDMGNASGPDIVVSNQVSGDVSVLLNDAGHLFATEHRYRAGAGLFTTTTINGETTVSSTLETADSLVGNFTADNRLDSGDDQPRQLHSGFGRWGNGQGGFADPQVIGTFPTGSRPSQVCRAAISGKSVGAT